MGLSRYEKRDIEMIIKKVIKKVANELDLEIERLNSWGYIFVDNKESIQVDYRFKDKRWGFIELQGEFNGKYKICLYATNVADGDLNNNSKMCVKYTDGWDILIKEIMVRYLEDKNNTI